MNRTSKYDSKAHIALLRRVFAEGDDISTFCAKCGISRQTWYDWRRDHLEFREAADIALEVARDWWERKGKDNLENPQFNQNVWGRIMLNRFSMSFTRAIAVKGLVDAKSHKEKFDCVSREVEAGNVTPDEAVKLGNFVSIGAKVQESDELISRVAALEDKVCLS